ncbi:NUDIX_hydrolase [Hexamita inflata]|uniref:NUDIX hydrolase n=1 Tax=Hexamita inflata TaxID=28002 RepID=A0AA86QFV8_9EUKA|nr:NUDIX hydrolase [Hexamita inflata]
MRSQTPSQLFRLKSAETVNKVEMNTNIQLLFSSCLPRFPDIQQMLCEFNDNHSNLELARQIHHKMTKFSWYIADNYEQSIPTDYGATINYVGYIARQLNLQNVEQMLYSVKFASKNLTGRSVAAFIVNKRKTHFVSVQSKITHQLSLVKGQIEYQESKKDALIREVYEETLIKLIEYQIKNFTTFYFAPNHQIMTVFLVIVDDMQLKSMQPLSSEEIEECKQHNVKILDKKLDQQWHIIWGSHQQELKRLLEDFG